MMKKLFLVVLIFFALAVSGQQTSDTSMLAPQFIEGSFEIKSIEKQKDVYVINVSKKGLQYKIASPDSYKPKDSKRIKVGSIYELVLYSYLPGNYFHIGGVEISPKNVITVGNDLDLYKALNLKGIYISSPHKVDKSIVEKKAPEIVERNLLINKIKRRKNIYIIYASGNGIIYKIVSPLSDNCNGDYQKIEKKQSYTMTLYSLKYDHNRSEKKFEITPKTYIRVERKTNQLYESPDLHGLYYIPQEIKVTN